MSKGFAAESDLKKFLPDVVVETSVGDIKLRPFRFKDMNLGLQVLKRWFNLLLELDGTDAGTIIAVLARVVQTNRLDEEDAESADNSIDVQSDIRLMLELSIPKDGVKLTDPEMTDWIDELAIAEVASLVMEVFELNKGFFSTKMEKYGVKAKVVDKEPEQTESPNPGLESLAA